MATKLYAEGQKLDMGEYYSDFIDRLPRLFRLTEKDLKNMLDDADDQADVSSYLENDHLKRT